jgi:hypothetical protein
MIGSLLGQGEKYQENSCDNRRKRRRRRNDDGDGGGGPGDDDRRCIGIEFNLIFTSSKPHDTALS